MDAELFQEKMDKTHRRYLCQMLNVKNLSEDLLVRYVMVKKMVDRIDGHLTPGDLALIIVSVGNISEIATELLKAEDDKVIEEKLDGGKILAGQLSKEQINEHFSGATGQAVKETKETCEPPKDVFWSPGMPVNVLHEEELKQGKIAGVGPPPEAGKKLQLTVDIEGGETETFDEDEVEAV